MQIAKYERNWPVLHGRGLDTLRTSTVNLAADFLNYKKRRHSIIKQEIDGAVRAIVISLLPVLDALDDAARFDSPNAVGARTPLLAALEQNGLSVVHCQGGSYDPNVAEEFVIGEGEPVGRTLRAGYFWRGKLLGQTVIDSETPHAAEDGTDVTDAECGPSV